MTLTQLQAFVLVARLGSVTSAAKALGVSEPAISASLAALRRQLGDSLIERTPIGMELSPAGRRVIGIASQIVSLAAEAEEAVRKANGAPERLRVTATSTVAECLAPSLLAAFTERTREMEVSLQVSSVQDLSVLLHERVTDVALGPRISGEGSAGLESIPLFRYRLCIVASPSHRLATATKVSPADLSNQTWLIDPDGADPGSPVFNMVHQLSVPEHQIRVFSSQAAAWAAAAEGLGVAPGILHLITTELDRGSLVLLPVPGSPFELLWYATMLPADRRGSAARALRNFIATPDATQAMCTPARGIPPSRFRPPIYVTIWS
jgi:DNA-binding transcriptional LysR family regulator